MSLQSAARLLEQATLGFNYDTLSAVDTVGKQSCPRHTSRQTQERWTQPYILGAWVRTNKSTEGAVFWLDIHPDFVK